MTQNATDGSVGSQTSTHKMVLTAIDKLVNVAKTVSPIIRPIKQGGNEYYVMFLHPDQVYDLRTNAAADTVTWYDTQKARVQGGEMDNGIFTGALGVYNGVVLHESTRVPYGSSASATLTKVRRAIFCGAQAASMAFGRGFGPSRMSWVEELKDRLHALRGAFKNWVNSGEAEAFA